MVIKLERVSLDRTIMVLVWALAQHLVPTTHSEDRQYRDKDKGRRAQGIIDGVRGMEHKLEYERK